MIVPVHATVGPKPGSFKPREQKEELTMITDEKILQFMHSKTVFVKGAGDDWIKVVPVAIYLNSKNPFEVRGGITPWEVDDFELEKPEPKREFEDGAWHTVILRGKNEVAHCPSDAVSGSCLFVDGILYQDKAFSFISKRPIPPELWEVNK